MKHSLLLVAVFLLPLAVAHADATMYTTGSDPTNTLQQSSAPSTPQSSTLLQPASSSNSSLQSADASSGGAGQSSSAQTLQQLNTTDQLKVLVEGDGDRPHQVGGGLGLSWLFYALLVSGLAAAVTAAAWLSQTRPHSAD